MNSQRLQKSESNQNVTLELASTSESEPAKKTKLENLIDELVETEETYRTMVKHLSKINEIVQSNEDVSKDLKLAFQDISNLSNAIVTQDAIPTKTELYGKSLAAKEKNLLDSINKKRGMATQLQNLQFYLPLYDQIAPLLTAQTNKKDADILDDIVRKYNADNNLSGKLALEDLTTSGITHVQRPMRYNLLLEDIAKRIKNEKRDAESAEAALKKTQVVANYANDINFEPYSEPVLRVFLALNSEILKLTDVTERDQLQKELINSHVKRIDRAQDLEALLNTIDIQLMPYEKKLKDILKEKVKSNQLIINVGADEDLKAKQSAQIREIFKDGENKKIQDAITAERFGKMTETLIKMANTSELNIDKERQEYIRKNLSKFTKNLRKLSGEMRAAKTAHELAEFMGSLREDIASDKQIFKTFSGFVAAEQALAELKARGKSSLNFVANLKENFLKRKIKKYNDKIEFIDNMNRVARAHASFVPHRAYPSSEPSALKNYERTWQGSLQEYNDKKLQEFYPEFIVQFDQFNTTIDNVRRHTADIEKLNGMINDLKANESYKNKYSIYKDLMEQLHLQLVAASEAQRKGLKSLEVQNAELSRRYQLALVAAEKRTSLDILQSTQGITTGLTWPNFAAGSTMQAFLEKYKKDANEFNTTLNKKFRLENQEKSRTVWEDLNKYNVGKKPVRAIKKAYKKYLKEFKEANQNLNQEIALIPYRIRKRHDELLEVMDNDWKMAKQRYNPAISIGQHDPQHKKELAANLVKERVKVLKQTCDMMLALHDSQKILLGENAEHFEINREPYQRLSNLLQISDSNLNSLLTSKEGPSEFRNKILAFQNSKDFALLPNEVSKKLNKLNHIIEDNFEKKKSFLSRSIRSIRETFGFHAKPKAAAKDVFEMHEYDELNRNGQDKKK